MSLYVSLFFSVFFHIGLLLIPVASALQQASRPARIDARLVLSSPLEKSESDGNNNAVLAINGDEGSHRSARQPESTESDSRPSLPPSHAQTSTRNANAEGQAEDDEASVIPLPLVYYPSSELTRRPQIVENIDFSSPALVALDVTGSAVLVLYINKDGTIDRIEVYDSSFDEAVDTAIINEFRKMKFIPAAIGAEIVASQMKIEVDLRAPSDQTGVASRNLQSTSPVIPWELEK